MTLKVQCKISWHFPFIKTGESSSDVVRHFLIESSTKGVRVKGSSQEPYFGKCYKSLQHLQLPRSYQLFFKFTPTQCDCTSCSGDVCPTRPESAMSGLTGCGWAAAQGSIFSKVRSQGVFSHPQSLYQGLPLSSLLSESKDCVRIETHALLYLPHGWDEEKRKSCHHYSSSLRWLWAVVNFTLQTFFKLYSI